MLRKLILAPLLLADLLVLAGLCSTYLAGSVSPATFWPLAFAGLSYAVFLALALAFAALWAVRGKWLLLGLHILVIGARADLVSAHLKLFGQDVETESGISVMSYNVHLFNSISGGTADNARGTVTENIASLNTDILCMQEYFQWGPNKISDTEKKQFDRMFGSRHVHMVGYNNPIGRSYTGGVALVTASRFPIVGKGLLEATNSRLMRGIFTDLRIGSDTVRVYNVHLESVRIRNEDFSAMNRVITERDSLEHLQVIADKLRKAFVNRAELTDTLAAHISRCPYPVIVCGDFNDTPAAYSYQTVASGLNDTFREAGRGLGITYARIPLFRIDHMLHSSHFATASHKVHRWPHSDHFAISAVLTRDTGQSRAR
jgi:endonuclease/exonuclease/phosphatase family metal-dependent hydrolase